MAYEVNFTNGNVAKVVEDGVTDSTYSVKLVGKSVSAYGEIFAENFIRLLENSANTTAPSNPVEGQLWFNSSDNTVGDIAGNSIGVYNGTTWKPLGGGVVSATAPTSPSVGALWFDTTNDQLKVYSGSEFLLVGPQYSDQDGKAGALVEEVSDGSSNHIITKIYGTVENTPSSSQVVATISKDAEFTPSIPIPGFSTIKPGLQLSSTVSDAKFHGSATEFGGLSITDFLRATANDTTSGSLGVLNDSGITVGASGDLVVSISGDNASIENVTTDGDIRFVVSQSGIPTPVLTIDGATGLGLVNSNPIANLGIATKQYVDTAETDAVTTANGYTDTQITALKSGASTNYDSFLDVENRIGEVISDSDSGLASKVDLAGDTMTGALTLSGAPTTDLHAATKKYVDDTANSITPASDENGYGTRTVSTSAPSGGNNGDIWYRI